MPLILNGSTGISGIDGSAGTPSYQGTDSDTGLWYPAANTVALSTSGTEVMRIDSSGRVGIGTTSPTYTLEVATGTSGQQSLANFRTADSTAANNAGLQIFATPSATAGSRNILVSWDADGANTSGGDYFYIQKLGNSGNVELAQYSNAAMIFSTNIGTERMRITSGGDLQFNSGYGSVATAYGCRAWVNFNGTGTVAIRASGNVSSITDLGIGVYEVNMTVGMPDTSYSGIGSNGTDSASGILEVSSINKSLAVQRVYSKNGSTNAVVDQALISVAIFR